MLGLNNGLYRIIVEVLVEKHPLPAKEIFEEVKKRGLNHPYNYVHKCLGVLHEKRVLKKEGKEYCLDLNYLEQVRDFLTRAAASYPIEQNVFLKAITGNLLKIFRKEEAEAITKHVIEYINERIMERLNEWYSRFYDPGRIEVKRIDAELNPEGKKILEVGCGTGRITNELSKKARTVVAIDNNPEAVKYTKRKFKEKKNISVLEADVRDFKGVKEGAFDGIVAGWVGLHYAKDHKKIIKNLYRILKVKGKLIIIEAYPESEYVFILNMLKLRDSSMKAKQTMLKEELYARFGNFREEVVATYYDFPDYDKLEETFKIELSYEEGFNWSERESEKLREYVQQKERLRVGEVFVMMVCEKQK